MGLFSKKFDQMQTEEQKYAASGRYQKTARATQQETNDRNARDAKRRRQEAAQTAAEQKAARVKKIGTLRKVGRNRFETTGWEIDAPGYKGGHGRVVEENVEHRGSLAGFTVQELCAMAHGPKCRCAR